MTRKPLMAHRPKKHEEHTNHEAWAIPYADLLTLLLAFFVVMYAISQVNEGKYRVLSDSLFAAFRGSPRTMEPIQVGEKQVGSGADIRTTIVQQAMLSGQPRSMLAPVPLETGLPKVNGDEKTPPKQIAGERSKAATAAATAAAAASSALQKVADEVEHAMDDLVKQNLVFVHRSEFWIEVEIRTDLLFPSGVAQLQPSAEGVIQRLADTLAPFPNPIRVEGHTDNVPIKTVAFYSNWELSAARAGSVVRVLSKHGVNPSRLAVIGFGDQRPVQTNDTAQGRNANRRVIVVILSTSINQASDPAAKSSDPGAQAADSATPSGADTGESPVPIPAAPLQSAPTPIAPAPVQSTPGPAGPAVAPGAPAEAPQASPGPVQTLLTPNTPATRSPVARAVRTYRPTGTEPAP
jgi:chemotaxis protein MotB